MKTKGFFVFSFLLMLVSACSTPPMPSVDIPAEVLNKDIRMTAPIGWNNFRVNDVITLRVEVVGDEPVWFPADYGTKMFMLGDGKWIEIEDIPTKYAANHIILWPSQDDVIVSSTGALSLYPLLPETDKRVQLRVFVRGNIYGDRVHTNEIVGGYFDIYLDP